MDLPPGIKITKKTSAFLVPCRNFIYWYFSKNWTETFQEDTVFQVQVYEHLSLRVSMDIEGGHSG